LTLVAPALVVLVLAPEERHGVELLALSQHIAGRALALALGKYPMLDAKSSPEYRSGQRAMSPAA
jgi:hypothetical protein